MICRSYGDGGGGKGEGGSGEEGSGSLAVVATTETLYRESKLRPLGSRMVGGAKGEAKKGIAARRFAGCCNVEVAATSIVRVVASFKWAVLVI